MSTTAVVEHFYCLQKVGPITRVLDTSFDRLVLTIHCRTIDTRRDAVICHEQARGLTRGVEDIAQ
jgi:hypothetical protein